MDSFLLCFARARLIECYSIVGYSHFMILIFKLGDWDFNRKTYFDAVVVNSFVFFFFFFGRVNGTIFRFVNGA